jgi:hypothetical protein
LHTAQLAPTAGDAPAAQVRAPPGEAFTALSWLAFARPGGAADTALLAATSRGRAQLHAPDGALIHAQRLHDAPVRTRGHAACAPRRQRF